MTTDRLKTLVLAGTAEARAVIDGLVADGRFDITASLAGATPNPASLPVPTLNGGFGGADGLAAWCRDHQYDLLVDVTHPFARQISRNARLAAVAAGLPLLCFERPPWRPMPGDDWRSFASWQDMADAIPAGSRGYAIHQNLHWPHRYHVAGAGAECRGACRPTQCDFHQCDAIGKRRGRTGAVCRSGNYTALL